MSDPQPLAYESTQTSFSGVAIGTIALQLVGVYCFVHALPMGLLFVTSFGTMGARYPAAQMAAPFVPLILYIAMGILLIRFAPRISSWLFRDSGGGIMSGPITTETGRLLQGIAFSIVGVFIASTALPTIVQLLWFAVIDMGPQFPGGWQFVPPVIQLLIGVALFLQSKGLALLWHRIRTGGVAETREAAGGSGGEAAP